MSPGLKTPRQKVAFPCLVENTVIAMISSPGFSIDGHPFSEVVSMSIYWSYGSPGMKQQLKLAKNGMLELLRYYLSYSLQKYLAKA
jgi:hypothetical protein